MTALAAASASPVSGQDISGIQSAYGRGFNVAVRERAHPEWDPLTLHLGGIIIEPQLAVTTLYTDNEKDVPKEAQSDLVTSVEPTIVLSSAWSRNLVSGGGWYARSQNAEITADSSNEYGANLLGRLDIDRDLALAARVEGDHLADPSSDPDAPVDRTERPMYDKELAQVTLTDNLSRVQLQGVVNYLSQDYESVSTTHAAVANQSVRNSEYASLVGEATYALSPEAAVFVGGLVDNTARPPAGNLNQASNGYTLSGGVNFDLSHLARGEVQLGYYHERYEVGGVKPDAGLDVKLDLQYFPTQLTTVSFRVARSALTADIFKASGVVQDANAADSPGGSAVSGSITVDHELLRNVVLSANVASGAADYAEIDRHDRIVTTGVGATYLMNRHVGLELRYSYRDYHSSGADARRSYDDDRLWLTTRLSY